MCLFFCWWHFPRQRSSSQRCSAPWACSLVPPVRQRDAHPAVLSVPPGCCTWILRVGLPEALNTRAMTYRWRFSLRSYQPLSKLRFRGLGRQCFGHVLIFPFSTASHFVGIVYWTMVCLYNMICTTTYSENSSLSSEFLILAWQKEKTFLTLLHISVCYFNTPVWQLLFYTEIVS